MVEYAAVILLIGLISVIAIRDVGYHIQLVTESVTEQLDSASGQDDGNH